MRVTVGGTEIVHDPDGSYTVFVVHVTEEDGREYDVRRRFSKFVDLRDQLIQSGCAIVEDLEFPSRKLWGSSSKETVTERQVLLNKWDLVPMEKKDAAAAAYRELLGETDWPVHRCSALSGDGCPELVKAISALMPEGPQLYPSDMVSDQPERLLMGELIREQVLLNTREEVPHSVAVSIDRIEEMPAKGKGHGRTAVLATVLVERKSQKGILIGKGGAMLKTIGQGARLQMQTLIDGPVYLELFVKVVPDWRSKPARLAELGYVGD